MYGINLRKISKNIIQLGIMDILLIIICHFYGHESPVMQTYTIWHNVTAVTNPYGSPGVTSELLHGRMIYYFFILTCITPPTSQGILVRNTIRVRLVHLLQVKVY